MASRLFLRLDNGPLESSEFRVTADPMRGDRRVDICCPSCAHVSPLPETHTVNRSGSVSLRWQCASESCPFTDFLQLTEQI